MVLTCGAGAEELTVGVNTGNFDLDATASVDPDSLSGSMEYDWTCQAEESDVSGDTIVMVMMMMMMMLILTASVAAWSTTGPARPRRAM